MMLNVRRFKTQVFEAFFVYKNRDESTTLSSLFYNSPIWNYYRKQPTQTQSISIPTTSVVGIVVYTTEIEKVLILF